MTRLFSFRVLLALAGAVLAAAVPPVHAEGVFPARPVKIVVASEAGSAPDLLARVLASSMGSLLGQSVVIDNRAGATGTIGAAHVAESVPDGYTLLIGTVANIALAPSFYASTRYDPSTSFTPIGMVASVPLVLVVSPKLAVRGYSQLQGVVRKAGTGYSYASPGVGSPQHVLGVSLAREWGVPLLHVPYKSGVAATAAVAAGDVQLAFAGIPAAAALIAAGKVVPVLVTAAARSPSLPDVPSVAESGLSGLEVDNWHALLAPAGLQPAVRMRLEGVLQKALTQPELVDRFRKVGASPWPSSAAELGAKVTAETQRWRKVVAENALRVE